MIDPKINRPRPKQLITMEDILPDFEQFYAPATVFESNQTPIVRFPQTSARSCQKLGAYRRKDYRSSSHWNPMAEESGIYGEAALQKFLGVSLTQAAQDFLNGLQGDPGYDHIYDGQKIDQKTTMGQAMRFKLSKTNRNRNIADVFSFAWIESVGPEYWVHLLGWAHRADVRPFVRDDGRCYVVSFIRLKREGVIKPVTLFKQNTQTVLIKQ